MTDEAKLLKRVISEAIHGEPSQDYIACGFFTEEQKNLVSSIEKIYDDMGLPYFSPRQNSTDFSKLKGGTRVLAIDNIFESNCSRINAAKKVIIGVDSKRDTGTMWELGYAIAKEKNVRFVTSSPDEDQLFAIIVENLGKIQLERENPNDGFIMLTKDNVLEFDRTVKLCGYNAVQENISSVFAGTKLIPTADYLVNIDNRPYQLYILMGYMYGKGIKYTTCSFGGYGSNVMIASSSEGHIRLNGVVDDRYNERVD